MNILILNGGTSDERDVSLRSGKNVNDALVKAGYTTTLIDYKGLSEAELKDYSKGTDAVFIALHGKGGEDGSVQALLEDWNVKYVGSDAKSSYNCISKHLMRQIAHVNNIRVAKGRLVDFEGFKNSTIAQKPFVLKPDIGGSSIDTFIVRDTSQVPMKDIQEAFSRYGKMLIEELVIGVEITVGVLGKEALPVIEIIPPQNEEFDYENKYNGETQEICPPINVTVESQKLSQEIAEQIHQVFDCRHMSRSDFIITPDGEIVLLDVNTIPGLTEQSLLPKAAKQAGYDMSQLVDVLVKMALDDIE